MSRLAVLFRNAHAIAKAGRPFSDMEWMCALDEKKEEQRVGLQQKLQSNNFFSIMVDGTTDSSVSDAEIIYIRQAVKGVVSVHFLAYVNITRGTADHILNAIVLALEKGLQMTKQTIFTKPVGCGSDGASVMTGCKSGVSTRLKGEQPLLFTLHCMAHRLELGFKGIIGANSFMSTFTELLFAIYNFYHSSALNRENLNSSCAAAGVKFLAPSRVGGTRWLPHTMLALKKLWNIYPALMQHFEQSTLNTLQALTERPGHYLTSALKDESSFLGVPLSGKYDAVQLKADMKCLVDGLTAQLEVRLGENGSDECNAFSLPTLLASPDRGCKYSLKAKVPPKEPEWVDVFKKAQDSCPNVLQLVDLLLSLPASSADCERGFSLTKVIKSVWRSRLRDTMVTDLMTIQQHSPEIADFDPTPSILRWKGSCKRRLSLCSKSSSE
ncbi:hypothetical protein EMCRGX_G013148 [Ephydatia muelleri]